MKWKLLIKINFLDNIDLAIKKKHKDNKKNIYYLFIPLLSMNKRIKKLVVQP